MVKVSCIAQQSEKEPFCLALGSASTVKNPLLLSCRKLLSYLGSSILFLTFFSNKWALYLFCYLNKRGTRCFGDFSLDRDGRIVQGSEATDLKQDLNKCLPQQRGEAEDLRPQSSEGPFSQLGWPPSSGGSACSSCECLCSPVHVLTVRSCVCTRQEQGHWKELELNPCQ